MNYHAENIYLTNYLSQKNEIIAQGYMKGNISNINLMVAFNLKA